MQYRVITDDRDDDGGFWARMDELVHGLSPDEKAEQARWQEVEDRLMLDEESYVERGVEDLETLLAFYPARDAAAIREAALGNLVDGSQVEGFTRSRSGERVAYGGGRRWHVRDDGDLQEIPSSGYAARSRDLTDAGEVGREVWLIGRNRLD